MTLEEANSTPRLPKPFPNIPDNVLQQFSMSNKVTAITGASAGIGWAVAEAIAEAGGHVALLYNSNSEAIAKGLKLAELHHVQVKAYQLEVSDPKRVEETINEIVRDFGRLDVFVANAGMAISKPLTETSVEEYRRQMEVNSMFFPLFFSPLMLGWTDFAPPLFSQPMVSFIKPNTPVTFSRNKALAISSSLPVSLLTSSMCLSISP